MAEETVNEEAEITEEPKEPVKPKRRKLIPVNVVAKTGKGVVVQWAEGEDLKRVTIPKGELEGGKVDADTLKAGVPYGLEWEKLELPEVTTEDIARELRRHNVWTSTDAQLNATQVRNAVQTAYKQLILAIVEYARQHK